MNLTPEQEERLRRIREQRQSINPMEVDTLNQPVNYNDQLGQIPEEQPVQPVVPQQQSTWHDTAAPAPEPTDVQNNAQPEVPEVPIVEPEVPVTPQVTTTPEQPIEEPVEPSPEMQSVFESDKEKQEELKKISTGIDDATKQFSELKVKNIWANAGTGQKILAAIAVAAGAYAQGLTGDKTNAAFDVIKERMQAEQDAYQLEAQKLLKTIQLGKGELKEKEQKAQQVFINSIGRLRASGQELKNQIEQLRQKNPNAFPPEFLDRLNNIADQQIEKSMLAENALIDRQQKMQQEGRELIIPGVGEALTKDDAKKVKAANSLKQEIDNLTNQMIQLREEHGGEVLNREAVARGKQLSKQLLLKYKDLANLGVLSESDMSILEEIIPADPLEFDFVPGQDAVMTRLKGFKKDADAMYEAGISKRLVPGSRIDQAQQAKQPSGFPKKVKKDGKTAVVKNQSQLDDALAKGWSL